MCAAGDGAGLLRAAVLGECGEGVVIDVVDAVVVDIAVALLDLIHEHRAVLGGGALVVVHVAVVGCGNLALEVGAADGKGIGAVLLIDDQLVCGEEIALGLPDDQLHIAGCVAAQVDGLDILLDAGISIVGPRGIGFAVVGLQPMDAVQRNEDVQLLDCTVAVVVAAGIVLELVQLVGCAEVEDEGLSVGDNIAGGVEHGGGVVVGGVGQLAPLIAAVPGDAGIGDVSPGIQQRGGLDGLGPRGVAILAPCTDSVGVGGVVILIVVGKGGGAADIVDHAVHTDVIADRAVHGVPCNDIGGGSLALSHVMQAGGGCQSLIGLVDGQLAVDVLEALQHQGLGIGLGVDLGKLDVQLGRGDFALHHGGELVLALDGIGFDGGSGIVEVCKLAGGQLGVQNLILAVHPDHGQLLETVHGGDSGGLCGHVDDEGGVLVRVVAVVGAGGGFRGQGGGAVFNHGGILGGNVGAVVDLVDQAVAVDLDLVVLDVGALILVHGVLGGAVGPELGDPVGAVDEDGAVVLLPHGDDGAALDEDGQLPQGGVEVVQDLAAVVLVAGEVVDPDLILIGQVDAVANVVAHGIDGIRFGIDGRDQEVLAEQILVLHVLGGSVAVGGILQEHGPDHGQVGVAVAGVDAGGGDCGGVQVGQQLGLHLQIHSVDAGVGIAKGEGGLGIAAPAVHVQHGGGEDLPLGITGGDQGAAAEDAVHVGADIGVATQGLAQISGDVEADVLPVAAVLVAGPDAGKALGTGPAVQGDHVGTVAHQGGNGVVAALLGGQGHVVAVADPGHVGLQAGDACHGDFLGKVAEQMPVGAGVTVGGQIALAPEAGGDAVFSGICAEFCQILHVCVNGCDTLGGAGAVGVDAAGHVVAVLAVAGAVAVVGQQIAQGHIHGHILVKQGPGRELIGRIRSFGEVLGGNGGTEAVQGLGMASLRDPVAAGLTGLAVGGQNALAAVVGVAAVDLPAAGAVGVDPGVTVVGVQMGLIEGVLRQQDRCAGDMVVARQQLLDRFGDGRTVGQEVVSVELVFVVDRADGAVLSLAEVIDAGQEGVAQHTVALGGVVEGVGRGNAAVDPVALVLDVDGLAGVDEAAVLGAAAEEVLALVLDQGLGGLAAQGQGLLLFHDDLALVGDGHLCGGLFEPDGGVPGLDDDIAVRLADGRVGMAVCIIIVGVLGDLYRVAVNGGGVFRERAGGIHIVAENVIFQECDLTADAVAELHGNDVAACRSGFDTGQRTGGSLCLHRSLRRNGADDHRRSKDRRKDLSAILFECFHIFSPSLYASCRFVRQKHIIL